MAERKRRLRVAVLIWSSSLSHLLLLLPQCKIALKVFQTNEMDTENTYPTNSICFEARRRLE